MGYDKGPVISWGKLICMAMVPRALHKVSDMGSPVAFAIKLGGLTRDPLVVAVIRKGRTRQTYKILHVGKLCRGDLSPTRTPHIPIQSPPPDGILATAFPDCTTRDC